MKLATQFAALGNMIGNTPLLEINLKYKGEFRQVYAKAEYYNLTGSIKDRLALYVMKDAYINNSIRKDDVIVEATSGNTGIAFAAIGRCLGHKVIIYMPNWMSKERMDIIRSYGAEIRLVSKEEGGFLGSIAMTEDFAQNGGVFLPRQFSNSANPKAHYETTGPEIATQLEKLGLFADAFVAGVGTGGTIMGISNYLRGMNPNLKAYPMEPENSPTMRTGTKVGVHRIQGISDEFIPDIVKLDQLDEIIDVDDGDAIIMAQRLSKELGIGVGISSGANLLAALKVGDLIGGDKTIVTVFSDDNKKYLSTDYVKEEPVKSHFLSPHIELLDYKSVK